MKFYSSQQRGNNVQFVHKQTEETKTFHCDAQGPVEIGTIFHNEVVSTQQSTLFDHNRIIFLVRKTVPD